MVKKGYYRNEGLGLACDRMEVCQVGLFNTTAAAYLSPPIFKGKIKHAACFKNFSWPFVIFGKKI